MNAGAILFLWTAILFLYYTKETDAAIRGVLRFLAGLGM